MSRFLATAALVLLPALAFAQGPPGPFGGLFGRTPERTGREFTALEFRNSVGGQYDDALFVDELLPEDALPRSGYTGGVNANLAFEQQSDRNTLRLQGGATYQEFLRDPSFGATTYNGGLMYRSKVATRLQFEAIAGYVRSPFFRLMPVMPLGDTAVAIPGDPYAARRLANDTYNVTAGIMSQFTKRSSFTASMTHRKTRFEENSLNTFEVLGAHALWKRQLTRDFAVRAGYGRERIHQRAVPGSEFIHEVLDVGVDFLKQLSLARRTSLGITTQTSAIQRPITGRRYRVNGGVTLSSFFKRTWRASGGVARATEFLPGFVEPLLSDSASGQVSGMLTERTEWLTTVTAGRGQFGFAETGRFLTGQATTRLNFALTRKFGVYGQYAFYYYELPPNTVSVALLNQLTRQSFTVGVTTWVPIINKVRASRDPE